MKVGLGIQGPDLTAALYPTPQLDSVNPNSGVLGIVMTLSGSGFRSGMGVNVGGTDSAIVVVMNDTTATAVVPLGLTLGPKQVIISGPGGSSQPATFTVSLT